MKDRESTQVNAAFNPLGNRQRRAKVGERRVINGHLTEERMEIFLSEGL